MKRCFLLLLPLTCLAAAGAEKNPAATPVPAGLRLFTCGHSFHVWVSPMHADLADAAGIKGHRVVGVSSIGGSRVIQHWDVPAEKNLTRKVKMKWGNRLSQEAVS